MEISPEVREIYRIIYQRGYADALRDAGQKLCEICTERAELPLMKEDK